MRAKETRFGPRALAEALREAANRGPSEGLWRLMRAHAGRPEMSIGGPPGLGGLPDVGYVLVEGRDRVGSGHGTHGHRNRDRQRAAQKGSVAEYYTAVQPHPPEPITTPRSIAPTGGSVKPRGLPGALSGPVRGPTGRAGCERPYIGEDFSVPAERPGRAGRGGGCGVGRATTNGGRPERGGRRRVRPENRCYFRVTVAPAPSRAALALSAVSLLTPSSSGFGALSTRSLASLRPRLVRPRTSLMTWIFL